MGQGYRAEIDGLRAVAVVPVILFHAGLPGFAGGYVGVDVFFVISGYLITGIIADDLAHGRFSILEFYERRARRILPALFVMLAATSAAAVAVMLPYELREFGLAQLSVLLFGSNILFYLQDGYFADHAALNPLIHTWSLAVEEQFYLLFPPVLWLIWRWPLAMRNAVIWGGMALSFALCLALVDHSVAANFYLLPSRGWEVLAGVALALAVRGRRHPAGIWAELLGLAGLVAIAASVITFHEGTPFPSQYTLLPVLGTVAILWAAGPGTVAGRLLSWPGLVAVGLISYSAYLWHQPVFAFARLLTPGNQPALWLMLVLAALTLPLAWATYRFVEQPFRRKDRVGTRAVVAGAGIGVAGLATVALAVLLLDGLATRYPEGQRAWIAQSGQEYGDYVRAGYGAVNDAPLALHRPNLVIVGDSFSQDFYNIIFERGAFADYAISAVYVPARCQPQFGIAEADALAHIAPRDRRRCAAATLTAAQMDRIHAADVVLLVPRWQAWSAAHVADIVSALAPAPDRDVIVVGSKLFEPDRRALLAVAPADAPQAVVPVPAAEALINASLAQALPEGTFVDVFGTLCAEGCPLFTPGGALISHDGLHLTPQGARFLGDRLFAQWPLAAFDR